jgi:hypothetical protein
MTERPYGKTRRRKAKADAKQSERFKEMARELGADESSDVFDRVVKEMAKPKPERK